MNLFFVVIFTAMIVGGIALTLTELFYKDQEGPSEYGDIHGNTSGRPRVIGYIVVAVLGFIALIFELAIAYGPR